MPRPIKNPDAPCMIYYLSWNDIIHTI